MEVPATAGDTAPEQEPEAGLAPSDIGVDGASDDFNDGGGASWAGDLGTCTERLQGV